MHPHRQLLTIERYHPPEAIPAPSKNSEGQYNPKSHLSYTNKVFHAICNKEAESKANLSPGYRRATGKGVLGNILDMISDNEAKKG